MQYQIKNKKIKEEVQVQIWSGMLVLTFGAAFKRSQRSISGKEIKKK